MRDKGDIGTLLEDRENPEEISQKLESEETIDVHKQESVPSRRVSIYTFDWDGDYHAVAVDYGGEEVEIREYNSMGDARDGEIPESHISRPPPIA